MKKLAQIIANKMLIYGNTAPTNDMDVFDAIYKQSVGAGNVYEDRKWIDSFLEVYGKIQREEFLPEVPNNHVRITHSTGLRLSGIKYKDGIQSLVREILINGLNPQAEGSGKWSELPTMVFMLADYPPGSSETRIYSHDYPWITADIPIEKLDQYNQLDYKRYKGIRPGSVITIDHVDSSDIIALNGIPKSWWS
jgi:hypothetical protein